MSRPDAEQHFRMPEEALALPGGIGLSRWFLRRVLSRIAVGHLTVFTPDGERICSAPGMPGPQATMILNNWRSIRRVSPITPNATRRGGHILRKSRPRSVTGRSRADGIVNWRLRYCQRR